MAVWRVAGQFGLALDPDGESWKRLRYAILLGEQTLLEQVERINWAEILQNHRVCRFVQAWPSVARSGQTCLAVPDAAIAAVKVVKAPEPQPVPAQVPVGPTIRQAWHSYLARAKPSTGTADEFRRGWEIFLEAFPEFTWDSPLASIERGLVRAFRDTLLKLPARFSLKREYEGKTVPQILRMVGDKPKVERLKSATVNKYLSSLRVTFNDGIEEFDLIKNPISLMSVNVDDSEEEEPLITEELVRVFGNEHFARGAWDADYRVPVLALYTDARLNELANCTWTTSGRNAVLTTWT